MEMISRILVMPHMAKSAVRLSRSTLGPHWTQHSKGGRAINFAIAHESTLSRWPEKHEVPISHYDCPASVLEFGREDAILSDDGIVRIPCPTTFRHSTSFVVAARYWWTKAGSKLSVRPSMATDILGAPKPVSTPPTL